jgi:hypothetical protein
MSSDLSTTAQPQHELIDIDDPIRALSQFRPEAVEQGAPESEISVPSLWPSSVSNGAEDFTSSFNWPSGPALRSVEIASGGVQPPTPSLPPEVHPKVKFSELEIGGYAPKPFEQPRSSGAAMALIFVLLLGGLSWYALAHSDDVRSILVDKLAILEGKKDATIAAITLPVVAQPLMDSHPAVSIHSRPLQPSTDLNSEPWRAIGSTGTRPTVNVSSGVLVVDSHPAGATIYLDGEAVGQTPLALPQTSVGTHTVRLTLEAHRDWLSPVKVLPREQNRVTASLEDEP